MTRILALLLVITMCFGFVAACSEDDEPSQLPPPPSENETEEAVPPTPPPEPSARQLLAERYGLPWEPAMDDWELVTFTYFSIDPGEQPGLHNPILAIIEDVTNVRIDFRFHDGDAETGLGAALSGGNVPDFGFFGDLASDAINSGHFMPIDELIEQHAPRLRSHYDPWWEFMRHADGRIYTAPIDRTPVGGQNRTEHRGTAFWLQKSVLDYFGRAPTTLDEYFDFIREYKRLNPTINGVPTRGFEILTDDMRRFGIENPGFFMAGNADWGRAINLGGDLFGDSPQPADRWAHDWNRDYYRILNREFLAGTFTAETLARPYDEYLALIATGAVLGINDRFWNFEQALDQIYTEGRWERTYLPLALTWPDAEPNYMDLPGLSGSSGINISASISNPVRAIEYLDWIIDERVQRFLEWGIEGEHYFYNEQGRIERPQEQRDSQEEGRWSYDNLGRVLRDMMPKMQGSFSDGNPTDVAESPEEYFAAQNDYNRALFERLGIKTQTGLMFAAGDQPKQRPVFYPFRTMPEPESGSDAARVISRIDEVNRNYLQRLITAPSGTFNDLWNEYTGAINAVNQTPLFDHYNEHAR